jgi:hypothetical protein
MPADVQQIFTSSDVPKQSNVFAFVLDAHGQLVHSFKGNVNRRAGELSWEEELARARARLGLPASTAADEVRPPRLPDIEASATGAPRGVRVFVRSGRPGEGRGNPIIEVVSMLPHDWEALALPAHALGKEVSAGTLRSWLEQLYPPAIRTADQKKPFQSVTGTLRLVPAGSDDRHRHALLRGEFHLSKGSGESAVEGSLEAVLTYPLDSSVVHSLRGVVDAAYLYSVRGGEQIPLTAAIESRPQ